MLECSRPYGMLVDANDLTDVIEQVEGDHGPAPCGHPSYRVLLDEVPASWMAD